MMDHGCLDFPFPSWFQYFKPFRGEFLQPAVLPTAFEVRYGHPMKRFVIIWLLFMPSCGLNEPATSVDDAQTEPATLLVSLQASPDYSGWLYSYALEWLPCEEQSVWRLPSLVRSAHAGHPMTFTQTEQWQWHQRILIGESQELHFQGPLENERYCGLHWLFAHGGLTVDGVLSSFQIEEAGEVLATSHHAWALNIEFDKPLCGGLPRQELQINIATQSWLMSSLLQGSETMNAREATLSLDEYISVEASGCP